MKVSGHRRFLLLALCFILLLFTLPLGSGAAAVYQAASIFGADYSGQGIPYTSEQLQGLVAPIALYPDPLLAQILIAASFPDQVLVANSWLEQNKNLTGGALIQVVNAQAWDPSVKGLTQFPAQMNALAQNLIWTSQLGEAYTNQPSPVLAAIQALRGKARAAGNLKSTPQMILAQPSGDIITLQPGNPLLVYVPQYNPMAVYGTPVQTPGYRPADSAATGVISFGAGVAIGALTGSEWGWSNWACNWYHGVADYRSYPYYGNHAWRGGYYGGYTYYGNHPYHNDANRPFSTQAGAQAGAQASQSISTSGSSHTFSLTGKVGNPNPPPEIFNAWARESGGWLSPEAPRGWGESDTGETVTAFSSWGNHPGPSFGVGGWGDRWASYRGWIVRGGGAGWGIGGRASGLRW